MPASTPTNADPQTGAAAAAAAATTITTRTSVMRARALLLPVSKVMPRLLETFKNHKVTIISGENGSGKSTQMPQAIYDKDSEQLGQLRIGMTQPRRLAAQEVSNIVLACLHAH